MVERVEEEDSSTSMLIPCAITENCFFNAFSDME